MNGTNRLPTGAVDGCQIHPTHHGSKTQRKIPTNVVVSTMVSFRSAKWILIIHSGTRRESCICVRVPRINAGHNQKSGVGGPVILWMGEILHHRRNHGNHFLLVLTGNSAFQGFGGGAKWFRLSTVSYILVLDYNDESRKHSSGVIPFQEVTQLATMYIYIYIFARVVDSLKTNKGKQQVFLSQRKVQGI